MEAVVVAMSAHSKIKIQYTPFPFQLVSDLLPPTSQVAGAQTELIPHEMNRWHVAQINILILFE